MSDALRQDTSDKVKSSVKPDSEKSYLEKGQESLASGADTVAGKAQPESEKSMTQKASDTVTGNDNSGSGTGQSMYDQVAETANNAATSAQNALGLGGNQK